MIIKSQKTLKKFRGAGRCEFCHKLCKRTEPAHIISKGAGGSDIICNLVRFGSSNEPESVSCRCHSKSHAGKDPGRGDLLVIVAARENCSMQDVLDANNFIRYLDKHWSKYKVQEALLKLPTKSRAIAERELRENNLL